MQQQDKELEFDEACEMMFDYFYNYKYDIRSYYLSRVHELLHDFERAIDGRTAENRDGTDKDHFAITK